MSEHVTIFVQVKVIVSTALALLLLTVIATGIFVWNLPVSTSLSQSSTQASTSLGSLVSERVPDSTPEPTPAPIPDSYVIPIRHHTFQTFNNCGPASLSMQLSYHDKSVSQQELGNLLRPYQHPTGDNDDKSVTLSELESAAERYGLEAAYRPNGSVEKIEQLVANDLPVVVRTWLKEGEDIGHYRVIRGYDSSRKMFIQDDSLQGKDLEYSYQEMDDLWRPFNYEYLVVYPSAKADVVERIMGDELNQETAWKNAKTRISQELVTNPDDIYSNFNMSVTLYHLGEYQESAQYFEKIEKQLPTRMLWYQIEPIQAYARLGKKERVFAVTDDILSNNNRAFSELYIIRGELYAAEGNTTKAAEEFEKARLYNKNLAIPSI